MVRFKARWMLVRLDFGAAEMKNRQVTHGGGGHGHNNPTGWFPTREDFAKATRNSIQSCFGTAASDAMMEVQVRFCDANSSSILMRVSRDNYPIVRACLTMITSTQVSRTTTTTATTISSSRTSKFLSAQQQQQQQQPRLRVVVSVVSVHGSLRTAKIATMKHFRNHCRQQLKDTNKRKRRVEDSGEPSKTIQKEVQRHCRTMEDCLAKIQSIE